jgi:hypothetical protein
MKAKKPKPLTERTKRTNWKALYLAIPNADECGNLRAERDMMRSEFRTADARLRKVTQEKTKLEEKAIEATLQLELIKHMSFGGRISFVLEPIWKLLWD